MNRRLKDKDRRAQFAEAMLALEQDRTPEGRRLWLAMVLVVSARRALAAQQPLVAREKLAQARGLLGEVEGAQVGTGEEGPAREAGPELAAALVEAEKAK